MFGVSDLNTLDLPLSLPGKAQLGLKGAAPLTGGSGDNNRYNSFVNAFETLQIVIPPRAPRGNLWPFWELFANVAAESNKSIDDWIAPLVREAIDSKANRLSEDHTRHKLEEGSLLDHIANSTDDAQVIRDEVMPEPIS